MDDREVGDAPALLDLVRDPAQDLERQRLEGLVLQAFHHLAPHLRGDGLLAGGRRTGGHARAAEERDHATVLVRREPVNECRQEVRRERLRPDLENPCVPATAVRLVGCRLVRRPAAPVIVQVIVVRSPAHGRDAGHLVPVRQGSPGVRVHAVDRESQEGATGREGRHRNHHGVPGIVHGGAQGDLQAKLLHARRLTLHREQPDADPQGGQHGHQEGDPAIRPAAPRRNTDRRRGSCLP